MKQKIYFKLFGDMKVSSEGGTWRSVEDCQEGSIGKKQKAFLIYLVLNHKNVISSDMLKETFWSNERKNPANSLKNMVHKTRGLLSAIVPEVDDLLLTRPGGYEWNPEIEVECDAEQFGQWYNQLKSLQPEESIELGMKAFELYEGNLLPGVSIGWMDELNAYYQMIFVDLCRSLASVLVEKQRWSDVIRVCSKAFEIAPEIEEFTMALMQALVSCENYGQVIEHYEKYNSMLWNRLNQTPSEGIYEFYELATHAMQETEEAIELLVDQIIHPKKLRQAFQCSLSVFRNMVQLELRNIPRSGHSTSVAVLKVDSGNSEQAFSTDIRRVEEVLLHKLRAGDSFTRLNKGTFMIMLPGASVENAEKTMDRIRTEFLSIYQQTTAVLSHKIYPLQSI